MAAAARMASATSVPATKRAEVSWPKRERSARPRRERLSDSAMKIALSMVHLILLDRIFADYDCQRRALALHYFLPQRGGRVQCAGISVVGCFELFCGIQLFPQGFHDQRSEERHVG